MRHHLGSPDPMDSHDCAGLGAATEDRAENSQIVADRSRIDRTFCGAHEFDLKTLDLPHRRLIDFRLIVRLWAASEDRQLV